ncbi:unnamed protein product [Meloidogyne enterolobii]|uniref:Uncharacterized protein n=2 Tax=Meloidogyne enterolobii TaxID=390850 RepID=A0A6V7VWG4_MELEN|nr:unnamed protein product [Meloidogyne enterolobii]
MDEGAACFSQQLEDRYFRTLDDETPIVHVNGFNNCVGQPLPKSPNIVFEGIEGDSTTTEKLPKKSYTSTALKNAIYRNKVSQHKYKAPKKTQEELFNEV